ncbi:hypothetical protein BKA69DRAFT_1041516 [Paraphysoderma sedebokerense]|nr:hypothetical protein BKA69DRAFT_1041516 [Paraphysoderma sedebokerense]
MYPPSSNHSILSTTLITILSLTFITLSAAQYPPPLIPQPSIQCPAAFSSLPSLESFISSANPNVNVTLDFPDPVNATVPRKLMVNIAGTKNKEGKYGVLIWWHGTRSNPTQYMNNGYYRRFQNGGNGGDGLIFISPLSKIGPQQFEWYFATPTALTRYMDDVVFADNIVGCLDQGGILDRQRIYTAGFSAGGLHVSLYSMLRPHYLAAAVSFSGGIVVPFNPTDYTLTANGSSVPSVLPYTAQYTFPPSNYHPPSVLAIHGGINDVVYVSFSVLSDTWTKHIVQNPIFNSDIENSLPATLKSQITQSGNSKLKEIKASSILCQHSNGHTIRVPEELDNAIYEFLMIRKWDDTFKDGKLVQLGDQFGGGKCKLGGQDKLMNSNHAARLYNPWFGVLVGSIVSLMG